MRSGDEIRRQARKLLYTGNVLTVPDNICDPRCPVASRNDD